jgi:predicted membrane metal-binding protein
MDGRESADAVLVYLAVGAISLGVAAVIRGGYVLLRKRRFWSPWLFVVAAVVAIVGYTVQSAGEVAPVAGAQALESRAE